MARSRGRLTADTSPKIGDDEGDFIDSPTATPTIENTGRIPEVPPVSKDNGENFFVQYFLNKPVITTFCALVAIIIGLVIYIYQKDNSAVLAKIDSLAKNVKNIENNTAKLGDRIESVNTRIDRLYETRSYQNGVSNTPSSDKNIIYSTEK